MTQNKQTAISYLQRGDWVQGSRRKVQASEAAQLCRRPCIHRLWLGEQLRYFSLEGASPLQDESFVLSFPIISVFQDIVVLAAEKEVAALRRKKSALTLSSGMIFVTTGATSGCVRFLKTA